MGFLAGKRAMIVGLASKRSIAWGIANAMRREGAELGFSYQNDRLKDRVDPMAAEVSARFCVPCSVESEDEIDALFEQVKGTWGELDILVHSVAFAPKEQLEGDYLATLTRDGFNIAHEISSYSFAALAKRARPLMQHGGGAMLTLSYLGGVRTMPNYNVMGLAKASLEANVRYLAYTLGPEGIRVNAVSAGPLRTLAAAGIGDFRKLLDYVQQAAPLRRNITIEEVGNVAAFLCSDLASGVTGEVTYVDSGFNIVAMPNPYV